MVDLPDVDETTLRAFLQYMYYEDDGVFKDDDLMCHVLKLAHRYEVSDLVAACTSRLEVIAAAHW